MTFSHGSIPINTEVVFICFKNDLDIQAIHSSGQVKNHVYNKIKQRL